jgi:hypothetical protein
MIGLFLIDIKYTVFSFITAYLLPNQHSIKNYEKIYKTTCCYEKLHSFMGILQRWDGFYKKHNLYIKLLCIIVVYKISIVSTVSITSTEYCQHLLSRDLSTKLYIYNFYVALCSLYTLVFFSDVVLEAPIDPQLGHLLKPLWCSLADCKSQKA